MQRMFDVFETPCGHPCNRPDDAGPCKLEMEFEAKYGDFIDLIQFGASSEELRTGVYKPVRNHD